MARDLELRLVDAPVPDGEIVVKDLAALTTALQEVWTRIGRDVVNTPGPGRTKQFMEQFVQLRLRAVTSGSTLLSFSKGPMDKLDVDLPEERIADDRFWEVIESIRADRRPSSVTDLVAESVSKLVAALQAAAPTASLSDSAHTAVEIESSRIHLETWTSKRVQSGTQMQARGLLEKVDLRSHDFRVRDDVGQAVELRHVSDDVEAARHVGKWVIAIGQGVVGSGRLVALIDVSIALAEDPASGMVSHDVLTLDQILASAPGPDADGAIDLSDEEFVAFLDAARG